MENTIKRVAAIHDLSGFGRSSLTTIIPTLSTMGVQVCPLPTAILSNHTGGFETFSYVDLTDSMEDYIRHWKNIGIDFDCIYSGFLGSGRQIDIVSQFIDDFRNDHCLVVVDPVMGDNGHLYASFTPDFIPLMRKLVAKADIITPNLTEAAFLLEQKEVPSSITKEKALTWLHKLSELGPKMVVITSVPDSEDPTRTCVMAYDKESNTVWKLGCKYIPASYPGTGDTFASVMVGSLLNGDSLPVALDQAVQFISQCIKASIGFNYPKRNGILLERELDFLRSRPRISDFEILSC